MSEKVAAEPEPLTPGFKVERAYHESEFAGLQYQWIERLSYGRVFLHFGGGYSIEIRAAKEINFIWPGEQ